MTYCALVISTSVVQARDTTFERLKAAEAEPQNWLMVHGTYDAIRYSPLEQINRSNADRLRVAFVVGLGGSEGGTEYPNAAMEATHLAEDGYLYLSDGWSNVYKMAGGSGNRGEIVWKTDPGIDKVAVLVPASRGVALYEHMVLELTADGRVVGMAKSNGRVLFDVSIRTNRAECFSAAPLVVKNKLIVGASCGDYGARGWL